MVGRGTYHRYWVALEVAVVVMGKTELVTAAAAGRQTRPAVRPVVAVDKAAPLAEAIPGVANEPVVVMLLRSEVRSGQLRP